MKKSKLFLTMTLVTLCLLVTVACVSEGAEYPTKPIELINPSGPGGGSDLGARCIISSIEEYLGVPMYQRLIPDRVVGTIQLVHAKPDGYSLGFPSMHLYVLKHFEDIPIDPLNDVEHIANISAPPWILFVPGENSEDPSPFYTLGELLDYAKENPRKINMSNSGPFTHAFLTQSLLEVYADVEFTHIPYSGGGANRIAVRSGEVDASSGPATWAVDETLRGNFRALAVAAPERIKELPDVPTFIELGYDIEVYSAMLITAPKGTPEPILDTLEAAFGKLCEDKSFIKMMNALNLPVNYMNRQETNDYLKRMDESISKLAEILDF